FALELAKRFQHSRVLDLGCNGVLPVTRKRLYETEDRKIVRFRSSTRENEFRGRYSQESCDASPCVLDGLPRALAFAMGAGWVSEHLPQRKVYGVGGFRRNRRGRIVIEIQQSSKEQRVGNLPVNRSEEHTSELQS